MTTHKTDEASSNAPPDHTQPEDGPRDIDLERVLYDPEYRQAVQDALPPKELPGPGPRNSDAKPGSGR